MGLRYDWPSLCSALCTINWECPGTAVLVFIVIIALQEIDYFIKVLRLISKNGWFYQQKIELQHYQQPCHHGKLKPAD
jgi:hypothetical protein